MGLVTVVPFVSSLWCRRVSRELGWGYSSSNVKACIFFFFSPSAFFFLPSLTKIRCLQVLHCYMSSVSFACAVLTHTWSLCGICENSMILASYHALVIFHHHSIYCSCFFFCLFLFNSMRLLCSHFLAYYGTIVYNYDFFNLVISSSPFFNNHIRWSHGSDVTAISLSH